MIAKEKKPHQLEASKWQSRAFLVDEKELEELFLNLTERFEKTPFFFHLGKVDQEEHILFSLAEFLKKYTLYVEALKKGEEPFFERGAFGFSLDEKSIVFQEVGMDKYVAIPILPVIQARPHRLLYSSEEKKFRSQQMGKGGLSWGLEFLFPQIFLDKTTEEVKRSGKDMANFCLFKEFEKWLRENTIPTPFLADGILHNSPTRIGKKTIPWIHKHPHLLREKVSIAL